MAWVTMPSRSDEAVRVGGLAIGGQILPGQRADKDQRREGNGQKQGDLDPEAGAQQGSDERASAPAQNQMDARPTVAASTAPKTMRAVSQRMLMGMVGNNVSSFLRTFHTVPARQEIGCLPCHYSSIPMVKSPILLEHIRGCANDAGRD